MIPSRVLVIDDDAWFADLLIYRLRAAGLIAAYAPDALEGMRQIDTDPPAVIVLDMFMPGVNGLVLLHELQSYSDLHDIPVIICSNSVDTLTPDDLYPYGVIAIFDKATVRLADIVLHIQRTLPTSNDNFDDTKVRSETT